MNRTPPVALPSVLSVQAVCSDGEKLGSIRGYDYNAVLRNASTDSGLQDPDGFNCDRLKKGSYNMERNWMMSFMYATIYQQKPDDYPGGRPVKLNCNQIPPWYVAVGYIGAAGDAVDGLKFIMAPSPKLSPSPAPHKTDNTQTHAAAFTTGETKGPAAPTAPAPAPAPAAASASVDPKALSMGTWIGIAASCLVGLSALVAIAYNVWKWRNKHKLVAAKVGSQTSSGSSSSRVGRRRGIV
jgi:hypothetical protein